MARPIIQVENLGKSYTIRHQQPGRGGYRRLSEELWDGARRLWRRSSEPRNEREEFWALKGVSFDVQEGEVVGIIGRNGAGKSTLLKILSRITEPTEGRVTLRGRVASLLEVGTGFHPELTGRENIFLNGAVLGMTRAEVQRKFDEIVDFAGVERFLDTPVKRYSSGMYVRLAFAVAAHLEPEILVVDEVLAVGDAEFQRKCLGKMHDVAEGGRTVLFVSHNMAAICTLCGSGFWMADGRIGAAGSANEVVERYLTEMQSEQGSSFPPDPTRPSIVDVRVDPAGLESGNLSVDITFVSPRPLPVAIGGLTLRSASGGMVWGSNGRFHPVVNSCTNSCSGVIRCQSRGLPLRQGQYILSVWLGDSQEDHDSKIDVVAIRIGKASFEPSRPSSEHIGYLDWPAVWDVASSEAHRELAATS